MYVPFLTVSKFRTVSDRLLWANVALCPAARNLFLSAFTIHRVPNLYAIRKFTTINVPVSAFWIDRLVRYPIREAMRNDRK